MLVVDEIVCDFVAEVGEIGSLLDARSLRRSAKSLFVGGHFVAGVGKIGNLSEIVSLRRWAKSANIGGHLVAEVGEIGKLWRSTKSFVILLRSSKVTPITGLPGLGSRPLRLRSGSGQTRFQALYIKNSSGSISFPESRV